MDLQILILSMDRIRRIMVPRIINVHPFAGLVFLRDFLNLSVLLCLQEVVSVRPTVSRSVHSSVRGPSHTS